MVSQVFHSPFAEGVGPGIWPHVGPITPGFAEAEVVDVLAVPVLEYHHHLMLGAVEGAHAGIILDPDANLLGRAEYWRSGFCQLRQIDAQPLQLMNQDRLSGYVL